MFCVGVGCCSTPPKQGIRLENAKSRTKVEEDKSPQVRRLQCSSTTLFHGQIKYNLQQPFCSFRPTLAVSIRLHRLSLFLCGARDLCGI